MSNVVYALHFLGQTLILCSEKDPTCRKSKLSRVESVRFQRAMYRIWLMSVLFGPRRFVSRLGLADTSLYRKSDLAKSWKDQKTFLQKFSSQELFQIQKLAQFLTSTAEWAVVAEGDDDLRGTWHSCQSRNSLLIDFWVFNPTSTQASWMECISLQVLTPFYVAMKMRCTPISQRSIWMTVVAHTRKF